MLECYAWFISVNTGWHVAWLFNKNVAALNKVKKKEVKKKTDMPYINEKKPTVRLKLGIFS